MQPIGPALPYRGRFGAPRPAALDRLALPPQPMPAGLGSRPLKAWRYVGAFGPQLMLCAASVRVGRARQSFWAVWDRRIGRLHERTTLGTGGVRLTHGAVSVAAGGVRIELALDERDGIESICASGGGYAWTRKQGGVAARGTVVLPGRGELPITAAAVIDDTAAYYERHTRWRWCAGVGRAVDGRALAWNLVTGINDPPRNSERTVWVDGEPYEPAPTEIAPDLLTAGELRFSAEATRERRENLLLIRSRYRQPFGTFSGSLPPPWDAGSPRGPELAEGYGVLEDHDAYW